MSDEQAPEKKTPEELHALERTLAYEYASSVIDGHCRPRTDLGEGIFDVDSVEAGDAEQLVRESVEYLEWRGLLLRVKDHAQCVVVLDESEEEIAA